MDARDSYHMLVNATLRLLDALAVVEPDARVLVHAGGVVRELADRLERLPHLPEDPRVASHDPRNPRFVPHERGLAPATTIEYEHSAEVRGHVTFGLRFGGTAAVHGGAISLFFDDFLGRLANHSAVGSVARTAYLRVDYRRLTPLQTTLICKAWVDKVEGRKRFLRGSIAHEGTVLAEAEGLWVQGRPEPTASRAPLQAV